MKNVTYSITYAITSPESAERGDYEETGFTHLKNEPCVDMSELAYLHSQYYYSHISSSPANYETDYFISEPHEDYRTGYETTYNLHIDCVSPRRRERIIKALCQVWGI